MRCPSSPPRRTQTAPHGADTREEGPTRTDGRAFLRTPNTPQKDHTLNEPCSREGCRRPRRRHPTTGKLLDSCTGLCNFVRLELEGLERLISDAGPSPAATAAWTSLVEISDQLTHYHRLKNRVYRTITRKDNEDAQT